MVRSYFEDDVPDDSAPPARREEEGEEAFGEQAPAAHERGGSRLGQHQHKHCRDNRDSELENIDRMHCAAEGNKAEAAYNDRPEVEPAMRLRDGKLSTLPGTYAAERLIVQQTTQAVAKDLKAVRDSLACHLDSEVRETFGQAWHRVKARLDRYGGSSKLHPSPSECDFPVKRWEDIKALQAHRAQYTARVEAAESQFDALALEPDKLKQRGLDLTTEVTSLKNLVDKVPADHRAAYAALLVAEYHATSDFLFAGVPSANAYDDYLRQNLACSVRGRRALTEIAGQLQIRECRAAKRRARYEAMKAKLAAEILAEVEDLEDEHQRHRGGEY